MSPAISQIAPDLASTIRGVTIPNETTMTPLPTAADFARPSDFDNQPSSK
jgi:hypothetical protein